jgi:hypothetical protein
MKKIIVITFLSIISLITNGQYELTVAHETYLPLVTPISLNENKIWDGTSFQVNLPFPFKVNGQTFTSINVLGGGGISFPVANGNRELYVYHIPFGGYMLKDKGTSVSLSPLNYKITGITGQQILKVEWKNAGFVQWYTTSDTSDYVDFQIWLFENDHHLEIHFGNNKTGPGTYNESGGFTGPSVKLKFDNCSNILGVLGNANNPTGEIHSQCTPYYNFIDATPGNGTVYRFNQTFITGIIETPADQLTLYPNPFSENFTCIFSEEQKNATILITDLFGKKIREINFNGRQKTIEKEGMSSGMYLIQITDEKKNAINRKIILN